MTGAPTFIARSMTLQIFSAYASDSEPPNTVKSWLKTKTSRPSIVPCPVTTPSPRKLLLGQTELRRAMRDERIELDEGPGIEQQLESLAGRQLAPGVLSLDTDRAAAEQRFGSHLREAIQPLVVGRHALAPLPSLRKDTVRNRDPGHHSPGSEPDRSTAARRSSSTSGDPTIHSSVHNWTIVWITRTPRRPPPGVASNPNGSPPGPVEVLPAGRASATVVDTSEVTPR